MRISDWSSDVCSSDLIAAERSYIEDAAAIGNELAAPDYGSGMEHPRAVAFGRIDYADRAALVDRKSVGEGKNVSVRVDIGGRRMHKKDNNSNRLQRRQRKRIMCRKNKSKNINT